MPTKNPNYHETADGYERRESATDAQHKSRLDWQRNENLKEIRQGVSDLRREQDRRNEEYRQKRGGDA